MNKAKIYTILAIAIIITAPACWIIYINQEFLLQTKHAFPVYFLFPEWGFTTAEHCMGFYLGVVFIFGFVLGFLVAIPGLFSSKNNLRKNNKELAKLQGEIKSLKNKPAPDFSLPAEEKTQEEPAKEEATEEKAES